MSPQQPQSIRDRLKRPKRDYQGNYETFDMPEALKPEAPKSKIPFGRIGAYIAGVVLAIFVIIVIYSMLSNSGSFL